MSTRYDDRDRDRNQRNYRDSGRRSGQDYDRSYGQGGGGSAFNDEEERYAGESRWRGQQFGTGRAMYGSSGDYESRDWGSDREDDRWSERNRSYGSSGRGEYSGGGDYGRSSRGYGSSRYGGEYGSGRMSSESRGGYDRSTGEGYGGTTYGDEYGSNYGGGFERGEGRYRDTTGGYSQRSTYPGGYRSGESYGQSGRGEYGRSRYEGRQSGQGRGGYEGRERYEGRGRYEDRDRYGEGEDRGWWDRLSDTVASWFGDEEAERRRQMERPYQGRGPKGYRRSDDRIREDVNDRLSEGYLDATEIEVSVSGGEVVLTGTVNSRTDKRRAEDIAEHVSGVSNVENRLRVRDRQQFGNTYGMSEGSSTMGAATTGTGTLGTTGTSATGTGTTGTTGATGTGTEGTTSSTGTSSSSARGKTASS
jgi:osmotically-inducible protein OsmY